MTVSREPMLDIDGRIMFCCGACGAPLTKDDFFDLGLRLPENGESKSDYCAAELIDSVEHMDCLRAHAPASPARSARGDRIDPHPRWS